MSKAFFYLFKQNKNDQIKQSTDKDRCQEFARHNEMICGSGETLQSNCNLQAGLTNLAIIAPKKKKEHEPSKSNG